MAVKKKAKKALKKKGKAKAKAKKKNPKPKLYDKNTEEIRTTVTTYYEIQRARIKIGNRLAMLKRDYGAEMGDFHNNFHTRLYDWEKELEKQMKVQIANVNKEFALWLLSIKGVGTNFACQLVSGIQHVKYFKTPSKLRVMCGYGVIDGKIQKRVKGQKINYNPVLKMLIWKITDSFVKQKGFYRQKYDEFKAYYQKKWADKKKDEKAWKLHVHLAAKRKCGSMFLTHLWQAWRHYEGLSTRQSYAGEYLKHDEIPWTEVLNFEGARVKVKKQ